MAKETIHIVGMHCGSCAMMVDERLEELEGVKRSKTSFARARAKVIFDDEKIARAKLSAVIADLGYEVKE